MIKEKAGIYALTSNNAQEVSYKPLMGIGVMYAITKDYGIELGIDNFNMVTIGFTAIF